MKKKSLIRFHIMQCFLGLQLLHKSWYTCISVCTVLKHVCVSSFPFKDLTLSLLTCCFVSVLLSTQPYTMAAVKGLTVLELF
jgi:hypothetical protein